MRDNRQFTNENLDRCDQIGFHIYNIKLPYLNGNLEIERYCFKKKKYSTIMFGWQKGF